MKPGGWIDVCVKSLMVLLAKRLWNKKNSPGPCMAKMFKRVFSSCLCPLRKISAWMMKRRLDILGTANEADKCIFGIMEENIYKSLSTELYRGTLAKHFPLYKNQRLSSLFYIINHKYFQFLPIPTPFLPLPLPCPASGRFEWQRHYLQKQQKVNYPHILLQGWFLTSSSCTVSWLSKTCSSS